MIKAAFVSYLVAELIATIGMVVWIGFWNTLLVFAIGFVVGIAVMSTQGKAAAVSLGESARTGSLSSTGSHALGFLGGALIAIPGVISDLLGICLLVPFIRRPLGVALLSMVVGRAVINLDVTQPPQGPSAPKNSGGGPIIHGEVIDRHDDPPTT